MSKLTAVLLALTLVVSSVFAKAGSSGGYSSSSGKFKSSSSSYGTTHTSYPGTPSVATKQYSYSGTTPTAAPTPKPSTPSSTTPSYSTSSPTTSSSTVTSTPSSGSTVIVNRSTTVESGPSLGSTILGTAAGAAVGTVIGNSINGNHTASQPVVVQPAAVQPVPVQPQAGQYAVAQPAPVQTAVVQPQSTSSGFSFWGFLFSAIWYAFLAFLAYALFRFVRRLYKGTKLEKNPTETLKLLPKLEQVYTVVQLSCGLSSTEAKTSLANACTPEMFNYLNNLRSENEERGVRNTISDITILDSTVRSTDTTQDGTFVSVKIRASMVDKWTNLADNTVIDNSDALTTSTDVFTFVSKDGETWKLSAIEEYETKPID